jgi:hypothetical protein
MGGYNDQRQIEQDRTLTAMRIAEMQRMATQQQGQLAAQGPAGQSLYDLAAAQQQQQQKPPVMPGMAPASAPSGLSAPPYVGMPGTTSAPAGAPKTGLPQQSDANTIAQASAMTAPPKADAPAAPQPTLANAPPDVMQFLRFAKQNGLPPDQVIGVLERIQPMFASEYKAATAASNAMERVYKDVMANDVANRRANNQAVDTGSKVVTRAAGVATRGRAENRMETESAAKIDKWDTEATLKQQEFEFKKSDANVKNQIARERQTAVATKSADAHSKFNAQIDADRQFITQNPPGSEGSKNDFGYYSRVERAMTQKIGADDPGYATWKNFSAKGAAGGGGVLGAIKAFAEAGTAPAAPARAASPAPAAGRPPMPTDPNYDYKWDGKQWLRSLKN